MLSKTRMIGESESTCPHCNCKEFKTEIADGGYYTTRYYCECLKCNKKWVEQFGPKVQEYE